MPRDLYFNDPFLQRALEGASLAVFDMNGLIIDDEQVQLKSVNRALQPFHISIDESFWIDRCVGKRADEYFSFLLKEKGIQSGSKALSELVHNKNRIYHDLIAEHIKDLIRPGVSEFIYFLSSQNCYNLGLCTSAHPAEIETILGKGGLSLMNRFSYIVSGVDVKKSKPDPEIYLKLLSISHTNPGDCLVFEDSSLGVKAAVRTGMRCIAIPNRFTRKQDFSQALCVIDNLTHGAKRILSDLQSAL